MRHNIKQQSLKNCATLKLIKHPQSLTIAAHVNNKVSEHLGSLSCQPRFLFISLKFKRIKAWLKRGVQLDPRVFSEIESLLKNKLALKKKKTLKNKNGSN